MVVGSELNHSPVPVSSGPAYSMGSTACEVFSPAGEGIVGDMSCSLSPRVTGLDPSAPPQAAARRRSAARAPMSQGRARRLDARRRAVAAGVVRVILIAVP